LLHGPRGVGKQRVALWLAQELLCSARSSVAASEPASRACGQCQSCRYVATLTHPDLRWVFPRPRAKDGTVDAAEVWRDLAEAIAERVRGGLLYSPPDGTDALYVATVRAVVHAMSMTPAMGTRKVVIVGDADRLVPQEGSDAAANAFLKVLEEPPADTTIILTSSEPAALLPTIRSRVVAVRMARVTDVELATWVRDERVASVLDVSGVPAGEAERVRRAHGAPGSLLAGNRAAAATAARAMLDAGGAPRAVARHRAALQFGASGARGGFTDTLDALSEMVAERTRAAIQEANQRTGARSDAGERIARSAWAAMGAIDDARTRAGSNVNPQLVAAGLLRALHVAAGQGL
jgi:DNA polymerase-3 subunit delta'